MNKQMIILIIGALLFFAGKKLLKNVQYFISADDIKMNITNKLNSQPWTLNQQDLIDMANTFDQDQLDKKKVTWLKECTDKMDYNCRYLVDYLYGSGEKEKALAEALKYCKANSIDACVAATKMKDFNSKHSEFFSVTNQIISVCQDDYTKLSDSEYWACDYYEKK